MGVDSYTISAGYGDCVGDTTRVLTADERVARVRAEWLLKMLMVAQPGELCWVTLRNDDRDEAIGTISGIDGRQTRTWTR